jgi:hypothetical protein
MVSPVIPEMSWFEKEKAVYFKVFWLPPGLQFLSWLVLIVLHTLEPMGDAGSGLAVVLIFLFPYPMIFLSGLFTVWGVCLIFLGLRQRGKVLDLSLATLASTLPFALFIFLLLV